MFVPFTVVVVQMDIPNLGFQTLDPAYQTDFG